MGNRADEVFSVLQALLKPFGITRYYADKWGAYRRYLPPEQSWQSLQLFGQEVIPAFP
jgi:IS1 family transposase